MDWIWITTENDPPFCHILKLSFVHHSLLDFILKSIDLEGVRQPMWDLGTPPHAHSGSEVPGTKPIGLQGVRQPMWDLKTPPHARNGNKVPGTESDSDTMLHFILKPIDIK